MVASSNKAVVGSLTVASSSASSSLSCNMAMTCRRSCVSAVTLRAWLVLVVKSASPKLGRAALALAAAAEAIAVEGAGCWTLPDDMRFLVAEEDMLMLGGVVLRPRLCVRGGEGGGGDEGAGRG